MNMEDIFSQFGDILVEDHHLKASSVEEIETADKKGINLRIKLKLNLRNR